MKIFFAISAIIIILLVICVGGYFIVRQSLAQGDQEYLLIHPTVARIFNVSAICPTACTAGGGVCGKDGKTYCNRCVAFQNGVGHDHDGACLKTYTNKNYGFSITFPDSWKDYSVAISSWNGRLIDDANKHYRGDTLIFKNQRLSDENQFGGIPIMIITPDVWQLMLDEKVAVSAAPIGPEKLGENQKYVFATPPRWIGFADSLDQAQANEASDIVKTFKAF